MDSKNILKLALVYFKTAADDFMGQLMEEFPDEAATPGPSGKTLIDLEFMDPERLEKSWDDFPKEEPWFGTDLLQQPYGHGRLLKDKIYDIGFRAGHEGQDPTESMDNLLAGFDEWDEQDIERAIEVWTKGFKKGKAKKADKSDDADGNMLTSW